MPSRILKESICTSGSIDALTPEEECFFYRLIVHADDFGCLDARPAILCAKLYPLRLQTVTEEVIHARLLALLREGLITLYGVQRRLYLRINTWERHQQQRAKRRKHPDPATGEIVSYAMLSEAGNRVAPPVAVPPPAPLLARELNIPTPPPKPPRLDSDEEFNRYWATERRKVGKPEALKAWRKAIAGKLVTNDDLIAARMAYCDALLAEGKPEYIKHPQGWINGQHWEDEPARRASSYDGLFDECPIPEEYT